MGAKYAHKHSFNQWMTQHNEATLLFIICLRRVVGGITHTLLKKGSHQGYGNVTDLEKSIFSSLRAPPYSNRILSSWKKY